MNVCKRILKAVGFVLTVALAVCFWYWPRSLSRRQPVHITPDADGITLMSCNVRCLTPLDLGKKSWFYRADLLTQDIAAQRPDIIGFQEVTVWQYKYLTAVLPEYDSVIDYRDKSLLKEGCPVFYRTDRYTLVDKGSFWLSETPERMSRDWGAACYRICSYVILTENATGKNFVVFNTHLDHVSDEARINGIGVVLDKIAGFGALPAVIMGDFNAEEGSATYVSATENFLDARYAAPDTDGSGTFQDWGRIPGGRRIDYFMVSQTGIDVQRYRVVDVEHDGVWAGDHSPIVMKMTLQ